MRSQGREEKGLGIIFHSGSYDRIYHGFSLALSALALGRDVKLFFTYWALRYLKKSEPVVFELDEEAKKHKEIIDRNIKKGHLPEISEYMSQAKTLGAKFYACTASMALLNISRDELKDDVDKSMGITTFLDETSNDQILYI